MECDSFLNLDDLYSKHIQRDKNKLRFYEEIFKRCIKKIKKTNAELKEFCCCYKVPMFIFGGPLYDYEELKRYLLFKLTSNGLHAEYIDYDTLYISWSPENINRARYEDNLRKIRDRIERNYNVVQSNVHEKTVKNRRHGKDNTTTEMSQIGVLQYNDKIKDLVPINPSKISRHRPIENFPTVPRHNNLETMDNARRLREQNPYPPSYYLSNNLRAYLDKFNL